MFHGISCTIRNYLFSRLIGQYLDVASKLLHDAEEPEVFLGFLFQGCFLCLSHFTVS
jgi:hypothetical protein